LEQVDHFYLNPRLEFNRLREKGTVDEVGERRKQRVDKKTKEIKSKDLVNRAFDNPSGIAVDYTKTGRKGGVSSNDRIVNVGKGFIGERKDYADVLDPSKKEEELRKKIEDKATAYNKELARKAAIVPNFANNKVNQAKQREVIALRQNYGLSDAEAKKSIYVSSDSRIGVGVANRIDEPNGLYEGVDRVIRQGGNPQKYRGGAVGNFARPKNNQSDNQTLGQMLTILSNLLVVLQEVKNNTASGGGTPTADGSSSTSNNANISIVANGGSGNSGNLEKLISGIQSQLASLGYKINEVAKKTSTVFAPVSS